MTRPATDVLRVDGLLRQGLSQSAVARMTGVPRGTLRTWIRSGTQAALAGRTASEHVRNPGAWSSTPTRSTGRALPQHGPGTKHTRDIVLAPWQERLALDLHPKQLLRGLIHSDGYRGMNRIAGRSVYPRYQFSNRSADIRAIFTEACRRVGEPTRASSTASSAEVLMGARSGT